MALKKDKAKVLDEVWTEARIKSFLAVQPASGVDADYHALEKAYQQMRAEDFALFVGFFMQEQRNPQATNPQGQMLTEVIANHRHSADFLSTLQTAQARYRAEGNAGE